MFYIDAYVIPVKKDRLDEYKVLSQLSSEVWLDHGALFYTEALADDVNLGEVTSYYRSVDLKEDEVLVTGFAVYKNKEDRDTVNKKAMEDPRFKDVDFDNAPFDMQRMYWGGFSSITALGAIDQTKL
ncbi:MAG TPA: DUF1428 domain-containing protein [Oligoflexia bacterium]|nr:DUF1428 domain-containing protein [Oligoflexia bacterium]HMR24260.1 DUF1428 domain-containing protein [Oligoflexia bacterium]